MNSLACDAAGTGNVYDREHNRVNFEPVSSGREPAASAAGDPFDGWEELTPREQAQRMVTYVTGETGKSVASEVAAVKKLIEENLKGLGGQQSLYMKASRYAQEYGVPFEDLVAKTTEHASMTPEALMEMVAKNLTEPKRIEALKTQAIEEAKATWEAERAKEREPVLSSRMGRLAERLGAKPDENPLQAKTTRRLALVQRIGDQLRKAQA